MVLAGEQGGLIQLVISLECFIEITPDFVSLYELHACIVNFRATATGSL